MEKLGTPLKFSAFQTQDILISTATPGVNPGTPLR